jgi:uncharacterized repeat protein (TIGR04138 family)
MDDVDFWGAVERIREHDDRFEQGAYTFVMQALEYTMQRIGERRHVSAEELLEGLLLYARERYGLLALDVLRNWGVETPSDIGRMVYQLVEAGVLKRRDCDHLADFDVGYDLESALQDRYFE